jgi:hypothetical protein
MDVVLMAHRPTACPSAPRAHRNNCQKTYDLAREAVGCMGVFGGVAGDHRLMDSACVVAGRAYREPSLTALRRVVAEHGVIARLLKVLVGGKGGGETVILHDDE